MRKSLTRLLPRDRSHRDPSAGIAHARVPLVCCCAVALVLTTLGCTAPAATSESSQETSEAANTDPNDADALMASTEMNTVNCLTPAFISECLRSIPEHFPTREVAPAEVPSNFSMAQTPLRVAYQYNGADYSLEDFPERTRTTGLIVVHKGRILHEDYYRGAESTDRFLSMSVAKSFTSTLLGIARGEGLIDSFEDPVTKYLPDLEGTGYDGIRILDILQMSSGVDFAEDYDDQESDIGRLGAACFGNEERVDEVAKSYGRQREAGTKFQYASVDTQILGRLLRTVTGKTQSEYTSEKLWQPMGAESPAAWVIDVPDESGVECALGGFNSTLRDYARFGMVMAQDGNWNGQQILPPGWVAEATIPSAPHVQPGQLAEGYKMGYQYQWWTFPDADKSFTGEGIHGQLLMVNPELGLVMVKTSDWEAAWEDDKEEETWALWDAIQEQVRG